MNKRNFVAKHMSNTCRPVLHINRKKATKRQQLLREVAEMKKSWLYDLI